MALHPVLYMSAQCTLCDFVLCLRPGDACNNIGEEAMLYLQHDFMSFGCCENVSSFIKL